MNNKLDLKKLLGPGDIIYIVVIVIGLFLALFLDEMPIRLIGACVLILGGVVLVMNISQRLRDNVQYSTRPRVSQPVELNMSVKKDDKGTRYVFDDFESSFGSEELPDVVQDETTVQQEETPKPQFEPLPKSSSKPTKKMRFDDMDDSFEEVPITNTRREDPYKSRTPAPTSSVRFSDEQLNTEFSDEFSGIRVIGKKKQEQSNASESPKPEKSKSKVQSPDVVADYSAEEIAPETSVLHAGNDIQTESAEVEQTEAPKSHKTKEINFSLSEFIEEHDTEDETEPRKEFDKLLSRVLMVIRSMMSARTTAFFWVNSEKMELVLEAHITDAVDFFKDQRKHQMGTDMISQIATNGRPEILTDINSSAELDLIPYYTEPTGTISFVGVPVYLNHKVIGVLCADSTQADAYDEVTIGSLGHFTKLISGLTQSYTGKYDLLQSSRTLDALAKFRDLVNNPECNLEEVSQALVESAKSIVDFETIGVVAYEAERDSWAITTIASKHEELQILQGESIDEGTSLIAHTIFKGETTFSVPVDSKKRRYHEHELQLDNGFFLSVPLRSTSHNYGALFLEGHSSQVTQKDITIIETLGEQMGIIIEQMRFHEMLESTTLTDKETGLLNTAAFVQRIEQEVQRSRDFETPFISCLVRVDKYSSVEKQLSENDKLELFTHVLDHIIENVRPYDVLGRLDESLIGIGFSGTTLQDVQLWAERIRKDIASSVKEINKKRFTVTVSIGLAAAAESDNAESVLTNTNAALDISSKKSNSVSVYA